MHAPIVERASSPDVKPMFAARRRSPILLVTLAVLAFAVPVGVEAARVLVVTAAATPRLERTLETLRESAGRAVEVVQLGPAGEEAFEAALSRGEDPKLVVALGPRASDFVMRQRAPVAAVHCLAGPDALRAGVPAIPSDVPADSHVSWLRKLVPNAKTIGVAFDPAMNTRRAEAMAAALISAGYRMLLTPVTSPAELPAALDSLAGRIDVLLALPDRTVYTPESARGMLLYSFRNRIPLIGPNDAWVRMGALYSLDWDYAEVGATCARMALRQAHLAKGAASPAPPRPRVAVNVRSAAQFGLRWDADLLRGVDERYE